jgi:two-component system, response regulator YesN
MDAAKKKHGMTYNRTWPHGRGGGIVGHVMGVEDTAVIPSRAGYRRVILPHDATRMSRSTVPHYTLLVVDDECTIREGISAAIPWSAHGIEVVGGASDGREALDLFRARRPDIVIADIQMENMNGLDFTAALAEEDPEAKVIIISGFDSFEYAQKALELRVCSYLLKPVLPEELLSAVHRCTQIIEEERSIRSKLEAFDATTRENRARLAELLLRDLLEGRVDDAGDLERRRDFLSLEMPGPEYSCLVFSDDASRAPAHYGSPKEHYRRLLGMRTIVSDILSRAYPAETVILDSGSVAVVVGGSFHGRKAGESLTDCLRRAQKAIQANLGATVTVAVGGFCARLIDVRRAFLDALRCLDYRMVVGTEGIIFSSDVAAITGSRRLYPADAEAQVIRGINEEDPSRLSAACAAFFEELAAQRYPVHELETAVGSLAGSIRRLLSEKGLAIEAPAPLDEAAARVRAAGSMDALREWVERETLSLMEELKSRRAQNVRMVIQRVRQFMLRNYMRADLSLLLVAEHVNLSPSYLSKLYRKETGLSYLESITALRMDEARRRLLATSDRVADIGAAVGYPNPQYFYTLFRRSVGVSPTDYREHGRAGRDGP